MDFRRPSKSKLYTKINIFFQNIGSRSGGMSPNNMPPLLFNNVHGDNVSITQNGSVARRTNSFCKAIAFSDRPVKVAEKVKAIYRIFSLLIVSNSVVTEK